MFSVPVVVEGHTKDIGGGSEKFWQEVADNRASQQPKNPWFWIIQKRINSFAIEVFWLNIYKHVYMWHWMICVITTPHSWQEKKWDDLWTICVLLEDTKYCFNLPKHPWESVSPQHVYQGAPLRFCLGSCLDIWTIWRKKAETAPKKPTMFFQQILRKGQNFGTWGFGRGPWPGGGPWQAGQVRSGGVGVVDVFFFWILMFT